MEELGERKSRRVRGRTGKREGEQEGGRRSRKVGGRPRRREEE